MITLTIDKGRMPIDPDGADDLLNSLADSHREFAHVTESIRDSALAGATKVVYGIHGLDHNKPCVARRYIADDGCGMSADTLGTTYSRFATTETMLGYSVEFDSATDEIRVTTIPFDQRTADPLHARRGIGGRLTGLKMSPVGLVTISVHDGIPNMVTLFRRYDTTKYRTRIYADGEHVVRPYVEPEYWEYKEAKADPYFLPGLYVSGDDPSLLDDWNTLDTDDEMWNPLYGIDWSEVVPDWIADHRPATGLWTIGGQPAHGTVKYYIGHSVTHSTGLTGDTEWPNEAKADEYVSFLQRSMIDLTAMDVRVQVLGKRHKKDRTMYELVDAPGNMYRLENETVVGHYPLRRDNTTNTGTGWFTSYSKVWDLDDGVKAWVSVASTPKGKKVRDSLTAWRRTNGIGIIGVAYNNEVQEFPQHTRETSCRKMGIPIMGGGWEGVSVIFQVPLADSSQPVESGGIYQSTSREGLRYRGLSELPVIDWFHMVANHPEVAVIKSMLRKDLTDDSAPLDLPESVKKYVSEVLGSIKPGNTLPATTTPGTAAANKRAKKDDTDSVLAVLEDPNHQVPATQTGVQGQPGNKNRRKPCAECGALIHLPTCSKYIKDKPDDQDRERSGTKGKRKRGVLTDETPDFFGRQSRRATTGDESSNNDPDVPTPQIVFFTADEWVAGHEGDSVSHRRWSAQWERPQDMSKSGGVINVNLGHTFVFNWFDAQFQHARKAKQDMAEVETMVRQYLREKLQLAYVEQIKFTGEAAYKGDPVQWNLSDTEARLITPDFWHSVFTVGFVMGTRELRSLIAGAVSAA